MQAYILECTTHLPAGQRIQIDNREVAFFIQPVAEGSVLQEVAAGWELCFFKGSLFEQKLCVSFDDKDRKKAVALACWLDNKNSAANNHTLITQASRFIRQSDSLGLDRSTELTANRALLVDRNGMAYFAFDRHQFKRILLCYALAYAYARVFRNCKTELTRSIRANDFLRTMALREAMLRFNAEHHCSLPVEPGSHELFSAWTVISEHYQLQKLNHELTQQLSDVAAYLADRKDKDDREQRESLASEAQAQKEARERREKRNAGWLSVAAVMLTAASLLSFFQLSPTQFFQNTHAWKTWLVSADDADAQRLNSQTSTEMTTDTTRHVTTGR